MNDDDDTPLPRQHEIAGAHDAPECTTPGSGLHVSCRGCGMPYAANDGAHVDCPRRDAVQADAAAALRDAALRRLAALTSSEPERGVLAFALACVLALAMLVAAFVLGGCASATRPSVETSVRRVDSMGEIDRVADKLGVDGWRIVTIATPDRGWTWVVVFERAGGARWE